MGEFEEKLNTVLSSPQAMEQIMALARALGGGEGQSAEPQAKAEAASPQASAQTAAPQAKQESTVPPQGLASAPGGGINPASLLGGLDPKLLSVIARVASDYNRGGDEKAALLLALRPFMKDSRAAKMDRALQIAKLAHIARIAFDSFRKGETDV